MLINTLVDDAVDSLFSNGNLFSNGVLVLELVPIGNWRTVEEILMALSLLILFLFCVSLGSIRLIADFGPADVTCPEGSVVLEMMMVANIPFVSLHSIRGQGREEEACCATDDSMSMPINHVSAAWYLCMSMESATATATVSKERPGSRALIMFVIPMAALLDRW
jgi:Iap family predicted aminopeptidase